MGKNNGRFAFGTFLVGAGFGAILALLFAPQSGEETRDLIAEKTQQGRDYITEKTKQFRNKAQDLGQSAKDQIQEAVEAGQSAYHEAKGSSL
ncbi:MAG: YtxH domain-containing protein [Candidatus Acidiferrales bacterium]